MKKQQQNNSQSNHRQIHEVEQIEQIALKIDLSFSFC